MEDGVVEPLLQAARRAASARRKGVRFMSWNLVAIALLGHLAHLPELPGTDYREPVWHDNTFCNYIARCRYVMRCHASSVPGNRFPAVVR
jgi:hypothetical protein